MNCKKCDAPLNFDQAASGFCSEACSHSYGENGGVSSPNDSATSGQSVQKYPRLRNLASLFKMLAALNGFISIILVVVAIVVFESGSPVAIIVCLAGGLFSVLLNLAIAEGILLLIDIEDNTSKVATTLDNLSKNVEGGVGNPLVAPESNF